MNDTPSALLLALGCLAIGSCNLLLGYEEGSLQDAGGGAGAIPSTTTSTSGGGGAAGSAVTGGAGGSGGGAAGGAGGAGGKSQCPASSLHDAFQQGTLNTSLWTPWVNGGASIGISLGVLTINLPDPASNASYGGIRSQDRFDLTDCSVWVERVARLNKDTPGEIFFQVEHDEDNYVRFDLAGDHIYAKLHVDGALADSSSQLATAMQRWWRIREEGGGLFWEISADASTWTEVWFHGTPAFVTDVRLSVGAGVWAASSGHGSGAFDNVNWVP